MDDCRIAASCGFGTAWGWAGRRSGVIESGHLSTRALAFSDRIVATGLRAEAKERSRY